MFGKQRAIDVRQARVRRQQARWPEIVMPPPFPPYRFPYKLQRDLCNRTGARCIHFFGALAAVALKFSCH